MAKVLVVDDSATMRKIVMKAVKDAGYTVEFAEAADGREALEVLAKLGSVDVILSDVNMPNLDGISLVRAVRDQKVTASTAVGDKDLIKKVANAVPIVMITTEGGVEKVQEALSAGANDFLKKPFTPAQIKEKLAAFLE